MPVLKIVEGKIYELGQSDDTKRNAPRIIRVYKLVSYIALDYEARKLKFGKQGD